PGRGRPAPGRVDQLDRAGGHRPARPRRPPRRVPGGAVGRRRPPPHAPPPAPPPPPPPPPNPPPDPARVAPPRLGVAPADVLLVAAHAWDVAGARAAGCQAAFVARPGKVADPLALPPDLVGPDLDDLATRLLA